MCSGTSGIYTNPLLFPLFSIFVYSPINGGALCPLNYASDSGIARIFQRGCKERDKATEQGEGVGGECPPSHGREIFENCVSKWHFFAH